MKHRLSTLFVLLFIHAFSGASAQERFDVTGVWAGRIFNDSTQQYLPFELAISRKNGVLSGYSYTVFTVDSIKNIGVKEVTIKEKEGKYIVRDKKLIDDNYLSRPAKGVYTTLELRHEESDTADVLAGIWFTNKTKLYFPLSGTAFLSRRKRIQETAIMPKLSALGLTNTLSFVGMNHRDEPEISRPKKKGARQDEEMITIVEPELVIEIPQKKDTSKNISLGDLKSLESLLDSVEDGRMMSTRKMDSAGKNKPAPEIVLADPKSAAAADQKAKSRVGEILNPDTSGARPSTNHVAEAGTPASGKPVSPMMKQAEKNEIYRTSEPPKDLANRKVETIRSVQIVSDSIVLSLFDNGTIDGDTVSVLLNGHTIISRIGLLATAYNHTVHLTPDMGDSIRLILYAENLGSIPPNTGLLVIRDGKVNHEIRFSGDLKNNSAIILQRKKKE